MQMIYGTRFSVTRFFFPVVMIAAASWFAAASTPASAAPPNDSCTNAIQAFAGANMGNNTDAAFLPDRAPSCRLIASTRDIWWYYVAPTSGDVLFDTCGTFALNQVDTILTIYDGSCAGAELGCDDDCYSFQGDPAASCRDQNQQFGLTLDSCRTVNLTAGQTVLVQVSRFSGSGTGGIVLNITPSGPPPINADLSIQKRLINNALLNDGVAPGAQALFQVRIDNAGPDNVPGVFFNDTWAGGGALVVSPATAQDIPAGQSRTWMVFAPVDPNATAGTVLSNQVDITAPLGLVDPIPADNTAMTGVAVGNYLPEADLDATTTVVETGPDPVAAGQTYTFALEVTNQGPGAAQGVIVEDLLSGLRSWTPVSVTPGPGWAANGHGISATRAGAMPIGTETAATFTIRIAPDTPPGVVTHVFAATADNPDSNVGNNVNSTESFSVVRQADLRIEKTLLTDGVAPGANALFGITIYNAGPSDADDAFFTETWGGTATPVIVPKMQYVPAGQSRSWTVAVKVDDSATAGQMIANDVDIVVPADVTDPDITPASNHASATLTVGAILPPADVRIHKTMTPSLVAGGAPGTVTLQVTNDGPGEAHDVTVQDFYLLNDIITSVSLPGPAGTWTVGGNLTLTRTSPMPVGTETISFSLAAPATRQPGMYLNVGSVSSDNPDANTSNNIESVQFQVVGAATFSVAKTSLINPIATGQVLPYAIEVVNLGPSALPAHSVIIVDALDPTTIFAGASPGGAHTGALIGGNVQWVIPEALDVNETYDVLLNVRVPAAIVPPGATIENHVAVKAQALGYTTPPTDAAAFTSVTGPTVDPADLAVAKTVTSAGPYLAGGDIQYTIQVSNNGPSIAGAVELIDTLPPGLTVTSLSSPGGQCSVVLEGTGNTRIVCGLGNMMNGDTRTVQYTARAAANLPNGTVLYNGASVSSSNADPDNSNNNASAQVTINAVADLAVAAATNPAGTAIAGGPLQIQVDIANGGPSQATDVQLATTIPGGVHFVGASVVSGAGTAALSPSNPQLVRANLPALAAGATARVLIDLAIDQNVPAGTPLSSLSTVSAATGDPSGANNSSTTAVSVQTNSNLAGATSASEASPLAGGTLTYDVSVSNNGPSTARDILIEDQLPADVEYLFATDGVCSVDPSNVVSCAIGDLGPGAMYVAHLHVRIPADASCGSGLANSAVARWNNDGNPGTGANGREGVANSGQTNVNVACASDLWIRKFGSPNGEIQAGGTLTYWVLVRNLGPSATPSGGVAVTDLLASDGAFTVTSITHEGVNPANVATTSTPAGPPPVTVNGPDDLTANFTLNESLPVGGEWKIVYQVTADAHQTLNNVADVALAGAVDPNPDNNHAEVAHDIVDVSDLSVVIDDLGSDPATAGDNVVFTVTVHNDGPSPASNVVLITSLPVGVSLVSVQDPGFDCHTSSPAAGAPVITCGVGNLNVGQSRTLTYTVRVDPNVPDGATLFTAAQAHSDNIDPDNSNNQQEESTGIIASSTLALDFDATPDPVLAGQTISYHIDLSNNGPSTARNVTVQQAFSGDNLFFLSANFQGGSGNAYFENYLTPDVRITLGDLAPGASRRVDILFLVRPEVPAGTVLNHNILVAAESPVTATGDTTEVTTVQTQSAVAIIKTVSQATATAGGDLTYGITVANGGPSVARDVRIDDALAAALTYLHASDDRCSLIAGNVAQCDIGDLAPGQAHHFDINVRVAANGACGGSLGNQAEVQWDSNGAPGDGPAGSNREAAAQGSANVSIDCTSDLEIHKFGQPNGAVAAGSDLVYYVTVKNLGPSAVGAGQVVVSDLFTSDGSFTLQSITSDRAISQTTTPAGALPLNAAQTLDAEVTLNAPLAVNEAWQIVFVLTAVDAQSVRNVADVHSSTAIDPNSANNHAEVEHDITDVANLAVNKAVTGGDSLAGGTIEYTIVVANNGPSRASNVTIRDVLPSGVSLASINAPFGCSVSADGAGGTAIVCGAGTLPNGDTALLTYVVNVASSVPGGTVLPNSATVSSDYFDPDNSDNTATAVQTIAVQSLLTVDFDGAPSSVVAGHEINYRITVRNDGPSVARQVMAVQNLVAGNGDLLTFLGGSVLGGGGDVHADNSGTPGAFAVRCLLGDLPAGASRQVDVRVGVAGAAPGGSTFEMALITTAASPFTVAGDDTDSVSVAVNSAVQITNAASDPSPMAGGDLTYHIAVRSTGPSTAQNVFINDGLPIGVQVLNVSDNRCSVVGQQMTCNLGNLAVGAESSVDVTVRVAPDYPCGNTLTNNADVTWTGGKNVGNASVHIDCESDLQVEKFGKPDGVVRAGEDLRYFVVVTNLGPSAAPAGDVMIRDLLASSGEFTLQSLSGNRSQTASTSPSGAMPLTANSSLDIDCTLDEALGVHQSWRVEYVVRTSEPQDINNVADVYSLSARDPNAANNHAVVEHQISELSNLSIALNPVPSSANAGSQLAYEIGVINHGPSNASGVVVELNLPANTTIASAAGTQGSFALGTPGNLSNPTRWYLGNLASGASATASVVINIPADAPLVPIVATAKVTADQPDSNNGDNVASAVVDVFAPINTGAGQEVPGAGQQVPGIGGNPGNIEIIQPLFPAFPFPICGIGLNLTMIPVFLLGWARVRRRRRRREDGSPRP